jgi:hypothetical protein
VVDDTVQMQRELYSTLVVSELYDISRGDEARTWPSDEVRL